MNDSTCLIIKKRENLRKMALIRCEYLFRDLTEDQVKTMPAAVYDAWRVGKASLEK